MNKITMKVGVDAEDVYNLFIGLIDPNEDGDYDQDNLEYFLGDLDFKEAARGFIHTSEEDMIKAITDSCLEMNEPEVTDDIIACLEENLAKAKARRNEYK